MKIRKGDKIVIITGKDKGLSAPVLKVMPEAGKVVVDGANLRKKHMRAPKRGEKGQRIELPAPIDISNVKLYCEHCKKGVRAGYVLEEGKKKRTCKKCNQEI